MLRETSALNRISEQNSSRSHPVASRVDNDPQQWGRFEINGRKPSTFEIAINPAVRWTDTLSQSKRDQRRAAKCQEGHLHTESQKGVRFKSGKALASNSFCRSFFEACNHLLIGSET